MREMLVALVLSGNAVFLVALFAGAIRRSLFKRPVHNILGDGNTTPELDDAARALHDVAHDHGVEIVAVVFSVTTDGRVALAFGHESCAAGKDVRADLLQYASGQLARCSDKVRLLPEENK